MVGLGGVDKILFRIRAPRGEIETDKLLYEIHYHEETYKKAA